MDFTTVGVGMNQDQIKQLISMARNVSGSAKRVQNDLLILIESTVQLKNVSVDLTEAADSILIELNQARGVLAETLATTDRLYQAGLDLLTGVENDD